MSCALNLEMREVEKALRIANAALTREEWLEAEGALAEVQDRVGHLLREVALKQTSVPVPLLPSRGAEFKSPLEYFTHNEPDGVGTNETQDRGPQSSECRGG
jgi:hypothetical protein